MSAVVRKIAIEAAAVAYMESEIDDPRNRMRVAIDTYETEFWQGMDSASADEVSEGADGEAGLGNI